MGNNLIILSLWLFLLIFCYKEFSLSKKTLEKRDHKITCYTLGILFVGIIVRSCCPSYPTGIFVDEAMQGYDVWCLANYGVDQHLTPFPVYLKSWGTGMSVLYAYMATPFVKVLGLNLVTVRLPMILIGCFVLFFTYYTLRKTEQNKLLILSIVLAVAISPWHIMKTRWSMDANLAPDLVMIATCFIILAYHTVSNKKQTLLYLAGFFFIGLSAYAYAVAWMMLPFYCLFIWIFLLRKKKITPYQILLSLILLIVAVFPLFLFVVNLMTGGEPYQFLGLTIPQLLATRIDDTSSLTGINWTALFSIIKKSANLILTGRDFLYWNSIDWWGQYYNPIGNLLIIFAIYKTFRERNSGIADNLFLFGIISTIPILVFVAPNTNHWNMLWFPMTYFFGKGIFYLLSGGRVVRILAFSVTASLFLSFCFVYFTRKDDKVAKGFIVKDFDHFVEFTSQKDFDKVHYDETPWVFYLFYNPKNPYEHQKNRREEGGLFVVDTINNNHFYKLQVDSLQPYSKTAYIISNSRFDRLEVDSSRYSLKRGENYTLLWNE